MKNVTVTLEEKIAHWARIRAAECDQSLSRYLGNLLAEHMEAEEGYEAARMRYQERPIRALKASDQSYPPREELHERDRLR